MPGAIPQCLCEQRRRRGVIAAAARQQPKPYQRSPIRRIASEDALQYLACLLVAAEIAQHRCQGARDRRSLGCVRKGLLQIAQSGRKVAPAAANLTQPRERIDIAWVGLVNLQVGRLCIVQCTGLQIGECELTARAEYFRPQPAGGTKLLRRAVPITPCAQAQAALDVGVIVDHVGRMASACARRASFRAMQAGS